MSATNASKHGTARCARRSREGDDMKKYEVVITFESKENAKRFIETYSYENMGKYWRPHAIMREVDTK